MGVMTRADDCREKAIESLNCLIENLEEFLKKDTWGHDEYSEHYITIVEDVLHDSRRLKRELQL